MWQTKKIKDHVKYCATENAEKIKQHKRQKLQKQRQSQISKTQHACEINYKDG